MTEKIMFAHRRNWDGFFRGSGTAITLIALFAVTSGAAAVNASDAAALNDDFDIGMFFVILIFGAAILVLIGVGIVIGMAFVACSCGLVALGIVSSAALIAILQRRVSSGLRALHYQICAAAALPGGIGGLWLGRKLFEFHLGDRNILLFGSVIGIISGICLAYILDRFLHLLHRRFFPSPESLGLPSNSQP